MATLITCGGSAVDNRDHAQALDAEASKNTPKESLNYGDFTLAALTPSQTQHYLDFLQLPTPVKPDLQSLDSLISEHLERIPFQGVDTFLGNLDSLDADAVFSKVVKEGRGGNCFELNSLFARLLLGLGLQGSSSLRQDSLGRFQRTFRQTRLITWCSASPVGDNEGQETPFLVDVGFGGPCPRRALPLEGGVMPYRLRVLDNDWSKPIEVSILSQDKPDQSSRWLPLYQVFAYSHEWPDFMDKSWYFATYPGVVFQEVLAASRYEGDCWLTLRNRYFTRHRLTTSGIGEVKERRVIDNIRDLISLLDDEFQLKLKPDMDKKVRLRLQLL
ncbi:hypothetical protein MTO96_047138 [Rhipicephalus appendiculatus]